MIFIGTERIIWDILEEHLETLQFLWERRCAQLRSPELSGRAFADLEERIAAHTDAVVLAGAECLPLLIPGLSGDDAAISLASGYALLNLGDAEAARLVVEALTVATGPCLEGLSRALSFGPAGAVIVRLREIAASPPIAVAAAASEVLAFHGEADAARNRLSEFMKSSEAGVRRTAWKIAALMSGTSPIPTSFQAFEPGLLDEDPGVGRQALEAAAWTRQPWLLDYCRNAAKRPAPDRLPVMHMLASLGKASDLDLMLTIAKTSALGESRFGVLAAFGHPAAVDLLLDAMKIPDPATAAAAAMAFAKITGAHLDSGKRVKLGPANGGQPDEFEQEFLEEVPVPDVQAAAAFWNKCRKQFSQGVRWRRGLDLRQGANSQLLGQLDLESCYEACLRGRFEGTWQGTAADLERFPRRLG